MTPQRTVRIYCCAGGGFTVTTQRVDAGDEPSVTQRFGPVASVDDALALARAWLVAQVGETRSAAS